MMAKILHKKVAKLINLLKEQANVAFSYDNYFDSMEAIEMYTIAIKLKDGNHVLYSGRFAAYVKVGKYEEALQDANKLIELNPTRVKGYLRKGSALSFMKKYGEALSTYEEGLKQNPTNAALLQASAEAKQSLLSMPSNYMEAHPSSPQATSAPPKPTPTAALPPKDDTVNRTENLGNDAYNNNDVGAVLKHYNEAMEHDPTDITFYNNTAAVYFEQKDYEKCISTCKKGIEIGRENRADFKLIAKAFLLIGNAYKEMENWKTAKTYFEQSMSEHRTPEVETILSQIDKKIEEEELKAYVDAVKAEEEKELGNEFFRKGKLREAVKHYTEALKRNPEDRSLYGCRARCNLKLLALDLAVYLKRVEIDRIKRKPFTAIHKRRGLRL